jgi:hypothetical protein
MQLQDAKIGHDRTPLERQIATIDDEIDHLVYEPTIDEITIVEEDSGQSLFWPISGTLMIEKPVGLGGWHLLDSPKELGLGDFGRPFAPDKELVFIVLNYSVVYRSKLKQSVDVPNECFSRILERCIHVPGGNFQLVQYVVPFK